MSSNETIYLVVTVSALSILSIVGGIAIKKALAKSAKALAQAKKRIKIATPPPSTSSSHRLAGKVHVKSIKYESNNNTNSAATTPNTFFDKLFSWISW